MMGRVLYWSDVWLEPKPLIEEARGLWKRAMKRGRLWNIGRKGKVEME